MDDFIKLFLDDFMVFSDLDTHLSKLQNFLREMFRIWDKSKPKKNAFMVFLGMISSFIVSKEGKLLDPKKVEVIIKMHVQKKPHDIKVFNN